MGRKSGDGGADVFRGREPHTLFCTDRTEALGKLYYYTFSEGAFKLEKTRDTGRKPRHTSIVGNHIVACNEDDATLTVFKDLALNPTTEQVSTLVIPTVPVVSFFIQETA